MSESKTPRKSAFEQKHGYIACNHWNAFIEQLETELAKAQADLGEAIDLLSGIHDGGICRAPQVVRFLEMHRLPR